ncbi:bifunctional diaminohydroxyphosphoribosylaminopyrimidine deaminase/5-amino-6-(5-phosphoribosylamino)uracil reductase RibD [Prevotella falsenii]|uniref:bifunctional diaminohydroxyphosphoribosylaminopyrimidine deaminase/5-amino-6-(5-phosphoribosylamino)uracil reductase RibD n=1 Tax=Prevotella falsenii TaxID=515414 RepID=UPI000468134E|nr:bifunctional diaminohydroxyphosphoribosylaminopyrimidine deaminase/5-amino-6-(5-phosphoribosylamino)uracil reductase RibD [Prevotella falsenii]
MKQEDIDEMYMRRCLQLARNGKLKAKPNPMVGAVIVSGEGKIIGEGYHICCGEAHAEVNAFKSVRSEDEHLLREATIYISLEPCSHYGKTPPCTDLIVQKGVRRVVCGCVDPFLAVRGRGIKRIREAGIDVTVGVLEQECLMLNREFIVRNTQNRPYILLKWAQTANGFIGYPKNNGTGKRALQISNAFTKMLVHKLRAEHDAILVGRNTKEMEQPRLTVREWSGKNPLKIVISSTYKTDSLADGTLCVNSLQHLIETINRHNETEQKICSLIVEGGARTLQSFIHAGLWDEIRVETAPFTINNGVAAPHLPHNIDVVKKEFYGNTIVTYKRS